VTMGYRVLMAGASGVIGMRGLLSDTASAVRLSLKARRSPRVAMRFLTRDDAETFSRLYLGESAA
jgi:hypothetical protein